MLACNVIFPFRTSRCVSVTVMAEIWSVWLRSAMTCWAGAESFLWLVASQRKVQVSRTYCMNVQVEPWPAAQRFANSPHSSGESGFTSASWFKIVSAPFTCGSCANREPLTATDGWYGTRLMVHLGPP